MTEELGLYGSVRFPQNTIESSHDLRGILIFVKLWKSKYKKLKTAVPAIRRVWSAAVGM